MAHVWLEGGVQVRDRWWKRRRWETVPVTDKVELPETWASELRPQDGRAVVTYPEPVELLVLRDTPGDRVRVYVSGFGMTAMQVPLAVGSGDLREGDTFTLHDMTLVVQ